MLGPPEAIERGNAYAEAGADIVSVEALCTWEIALHRTRDHARKLIQNIVVAG